MPRYCRAYQATDLRRFEPLDRWLEETADAAQADVLYLWSDLTVVADPLNDEPAFTSPTPEWRTFCAVDLGFAVPADVVAAGHGDSG